jgi:hypothetical protein
MSDEPSSTPEDAPVEAAEPDRAADAATPKRGRPKGSTNARKTRSVQLTLTVTGTAEGEWQAELKNGSTWVARGVSVPASAVSRAAKELHEDISSGIDEVIGAAREQQRKKLEELEAEMARVKQTLADLE